MERLNEMFYFKIENLKIRILKRCFSPEMYIWRKNFVCFYYFNHPFKRKSLPFLYVYAFGLKKKALLLVFILLLARTAPFRVWIEWENRICCSFYSLHNEPSHSHFIWTGPLSFSKDYLEAPSYGSYPLTCLCLQQHVCQMPITFRFLFITWQFYIHKWVFQASSWWSCSLNFRFLLFTVLDTSNNIAINVMP